MGGEKLRLYNYENTGGKLRDAHQQIGEAALFFLFFGKIDHALNEPGYDEADTDSFEDDL